MKFRKTTAVLLTALIAGSCVFFTGCESDDGKKITAQNSTSQSIVSTSSLKGEELSERDIIRINQLYGSAGCIFLCKKNKIALSDDYISKITAEGKFLLGGLDLTIVGTSDLSKLICADNVLSLGESDRLKKELYTRYNAESKLFDEYAGDTYEGLDADQKTAMQMTSTDAVWMQLNVFDITDDKYDFYDLAIKAFNDNVSKYNHNDIYSGRWTITSELENLFYYCLINDKLDKLNYKAIWDVLGPNYMRDLFETNAENSSFSEKSIANISGMLTDIKSKDVLGADIKPKYAVQEYYNSLDKNSDFLYNINSEDHIYYEYTLFLDLSQPKELKLSENSFFTENVGKWLKECYETNHMTEKSKL